MADEEEREAPGGIAVFPEIPAELGVDPLLLALIHTTVFIAGSDDAIIDPDAAAEVMDTLSQYIQRLDGARLQRVKEDLLALTGYARQQQWPKQEMRFLKEFLSSYGVGEEQKEE